MSAYKQRYTSTLRAHKALGVLLGIGLGICMLTGCTDPQLAKNEQAMSTLGDWFAAATRGQREDSLCHGLGTLKHAEASCADMLEHAARIDPQTRDIKSIGDLDCFGGICGEFVRIELTGRDLDGNPAAEQALLKRDEGIFRLYWYRSDSLLAQLRAGMPADDAQEKEPIQIAYDQITERYPALYQYPPCYGIRVSSSNLRHALMRKDAIDVEAVERIAAECGEAFCFALVGEKIAAVCPASD